MNKALSASILFSLAAASGLVGMSRVGVCIESSASCLVREFLGSLVAASAGPLESPSDVADAIEESLPGDSSGTKVEMEVVLLSRDGRVEWIPSDFSNATAIELGFQFDGARPCHRSEHPAG